MDELKKQAPCIQTMCYWFVELEKRGNVTKHNCFRCQVEMGRTAEDFGGQSELAIHKFQSSDGTLIVQGP